MTASYTASCPRCGADATWTTRYTDNITHGNQTTTIACHQCDEAAA